MSPAPAGFSPQETVEAWFACWLRAVRSAHPGSAAVAAAQLRLLGVQVAAIPRGTAP